MVTPMTPPSSSTLSAFGLKLNQDSSLSALDGGRGTCYIHRPSSNESTWTVLRPADDAVETDFLSEVASKLLETPSTQYRLAQPIPVSKSSNTDSSVLAKGYVTSDNWTAQTYLSGTASPKTHWNELFAASRAFHADIVHICKHRPPAFLDDSMKTNRWREADRVVWNEKTLEDVANVSHDMLEHFRPMFDRLQRLSAQLKQIAPEPDWSSKCQLIHGDLTGNVLFDGQKDDVREDGAERQEKRNLPPAIIDLTPYWRPARYADAIVLADALAWHGEGLELLRACGCVDDDEGWYLLIKALHWRALTFAIDTDVEWVKMHLGKSDYEGAVKVMETAFVQRKHH